MEKVNKEERLKEEDVDNALREMYVKLSGRKFELPRGIVNYYSLEKGDALLCELVELKGEDQTKSCAVGKDILIDVTQFQNFDPDGSFPDAVFDLYRIREYKYALLKIKKAIRKR